MRLMEYVVVKEETLPKVEQHSFVYRLQNGMVQRTTVKAWVTKVTRRRRYLKWLPLSSTVKRYLNVEFEDEIGECVGSWKGGVIAGNYLMDKNESIVSCLKRIQENRELS